MGVSYHNHLIFGVQLEEAVIHGKKTQYDSDTGKPYEIDTEEEIFVIKGTSIQVKWDEDGDIPDEIFYEDYDDKSTYYYGVKVPSSHIDGNESKEIGQSQIEPTRQKAGGLLNGMGYSGEIKLISVMHCSY